MEGCKTVKIILARPTPNGPYVFQQSICPDGEFVAAYTADGVQLWRHKLSDKGIAAGVPNSPEGNDYKVEGNRLDARAASICDSVTKGMEQQKVHELIAQRNITFRQETAGNLWVVDEQNAQCKLWFDERALPRKKKKVFVAE
jgi:hypothetical protein